MSTSDIVRVPPANQDADVDVVIDGESYGLQTKSLRLIPQDFLQGVHAAAGGLLGSAQVFIVHDADPAVAR